MCWSSYEPELSRLYINCMMVFLYTCRTCAVRIIVCIIIHTVKQRILLVQYNFCGYCSINFVTNSCTMATPPTYFKKLNAVPFDSGLKLSLMGVAFFLSYNNRLAFAEQSPSSVVACLAVQILSFFLVYVCPPDSYSDHPLKPRDSVQPQSYTGSGSTPWRNIRDLSWRNSQTGTRYITVQLATAIWISKGYTISMVRHPTSSHLII